MKKCKKCDSEMFLVKREKDYAWSCGRCKTEENTWLIITKPSLTNRWPINSMRLFDSADLPRDSERHRAIGHEFSYEHEFGNFKITDIAFNLGFSYLKGFYFWLCTQKLIMTPSFFNFIFAGSSYHFTFNKLYEFINENGNISLEDFDEENAEMIDPSIDPWLRAFEAAAEARAIGILETDKAHRIKARSHNW